MTPVSTSIKIDPALKEESQALFESFGLSLSAAVNMFLRQAVREQAIPFRVGNHLPNLETLQAIENARKLAGYNLMVTSEIYMSASEIYTAYHNLWRIEESFKIMKSQLDARPVYLQKEDTITGHFLICYLAVVLTRILQIYALKDKYGTEEIYDFIRDFRVAKISDRKYINLTRSSPFIKALADETSLPLTSYFLGNESINKVLNHRF